MAELQLDWSPVQDRSSGTAPFPPGSSGPGSQDRVLAVTLGVLHALAGGVPTEDAVCCCLAREVDVVLAAYVALDPVARTATVVAWPGPLDTARVQGIVDALRPSAMSGGAPDRRARCQTAESGPAGWRGTSAARRLEQAFGCGDIAHVALDVPGPTRRVVVLGATSHVSSATVRLLDRLRGPLSDLLQITGEQGTAAVPASPGPVPCLTDREIEVLGLTAQGLLARTIALRLAVSPRTVHKHLGNIYRKLDAHDRLVAVRRAEHLGLLGRAPRPVSIAGGRLLPQVVEVRPAAAGGRSWPARP